MPPWLFRVGLEPGEREHPLDLLLGVVEEMAGVSPSLQLPDLEVQGRVAERHDLLENQTAARTEDSGYLRHGSQRTRLLGETQTPDDQVELAGVEREAMQRAGVEEHVGGAHGSREPPAFFSQFVVRLHGLHDRGDGSHLEGDEARPSAQVQHTIARPWGRQRQCLREGVFACAGEEIVVDQDGSYASSRHPLHGHVDRQAVHFQVLPVGASVRRRRRFPGVAQWTR